MIIAATALLVFLVLGLWIIPFSWNKRGHRDPQEPNDTPSGKLPKTESDPECPQPPDIHIPFKLIKPKQGKPYCIGFFEVTQTQWNQVMKEGENPSFHPGLDRPVEKVTLEEAREFNRRLNELDPAGMYRLPNSEERIYAAHAGALTGFDFSDDIKLLPRYGNCSSRDDYPRTAPVGEFKPNRLGLYDMLGNVAEWVEGGAPAGQGVIQGGSWDSPGVKCRAEASQVIDAQSDWNTVGFRIVREPILVKK